MPTLRNVSPYGALEIPLLGRVVGAGEEFDVSDEQAERLLPQAENYQLVTKPKKSTATSEVSE